MSKMYLVKPDGIDTEWNATNYGENEYTQLSMKMIMPTEKSSETYGIFQELLFRLGWRANDTGERHGLISFGKEIRDCRFV